MSLRGVAAPDLAGALARARRILYLGILTPIVVASVLIIAISVAGFEMSSAVRAYVGGESMWSKGRSEAVAQLRLFAATGNPSAYNAFEAALSAPMGDRTARLEMDRSDGSMDKITVGLVQGGNSVDDVSRIVWLYRNFRHVPPMREVVAVWVEGDRLIAQLRDLAAELKLRWGTPGQDVRVAQLLGDIDTVNLRLVELERNFTATLGQASRDITRVLKVAVLGIGLLVTLGAALMVRKSWLLHLRDHRQIVAEQAALGAANRRWELAAEAAGLGLFDWAVESNRFHADDRARRLYGLPLAGPITREALANAHHRDDLAKIGAMTREAVETGKVVVCRYRVNQGPRGWRLLEATCLARRDGSDAADPLITAVVRDVSDEQQRTQDALEAALVRECDAVRAQFLSRLSHELRTPLNAILGFSQLMMGRSAHRLDPEDLQRLRQISNSGLALLDMVESVFDLQRAQDGSLAWKDEPVRIDCVLSTSVALIEPLRTRHDCTVLGPLPDVEAWVRVDRDRLEQVFCNLLSNACKFNRRNGLVVIGCVLVAGQVEVSITDEGRGLSPAEMSALFAPLWRARAPSHVDGAGMGLAVSRMLVERMGGAIRVASTPGAGSTFTVSLPCCAAPTPDAVAAQAARAV